MNIWNCAENGDYSQVDFTKAPWVAGVGEYTHEQVVEVKEACAVLAVGHETDDFYIQSRYNQSVNYEKAINGETYFCMKAYDVEINTLGIDANGIILPAEQPAEGEAPVVEGVETPVEEV